MDLKERFGGKLAASVKETAEALGMSPQAVYDCIRRGDLPSVKIGTMIKVPVGPLLKMMGAE